MKTFAVFLLACLSAVAQKQSTPVSTSYSLPANQLNASPYVQTGGGAPSSVACNTPGLDRYFDTVGLVTYDCTAAGTPGTWAIRSNFSNSKVWAALSATLPLTFNSGTGAFACNVASGSQAGCLASGDWTTFNGKQAALGYTPANVASNLSDLASASTARTNLGLGTAATQATAAFLLVTNNLSDLGNAATARANLGLGPAALLNVWGSGSRAVLANALGVSGNCVQWVAAGLGDTGSPCGTGGANALGTYLTASSANAPANAVNLGALSAGLLKLAVSGSVATPSTATPGTDYVTPAGNVATATALAALPTPCSAGSAPTGILANGNSTGCAAIPVAPSFHAYSGSSSVDFSIYSSVRVTASGGNPTVTVAASPISGSTVYIELCNDTTARTWTLPSTFQRIAAPAVASNCVYAIANYDTTSGNYNGLGSDETPTVVRFTAERADPGTGNCPNGGCLFPDSTAHNLRFRNSSDVVSAPVKVGIDVATETGQVTNGSHITNASLPNSGLVNAALTANGQACTLGSTCNVNSGAAAHSVALNEGAGAAIGAATIGTAGRILIDQGAGADPLFESASGDVTVASSGAHTIAANAVTSAKQAVVNTRRTCVIDNDTQSSTALTAAQFSGHCDIPAAATIVEVDVFGGTQTLTGTATVPTFTGTSSIQIGKYTPNGGSSATGLLSAALATVSGKACALTSTSGTCISGITSSSSVTISTTSLSAGDVLSVTAATPDTAQTWYTVTIVYVIN